MTAGALEIRGLSVSYRRKSVLRDVTLGPWVPGELTALVGPNAAGKSTLLKAIAGLIPAKGAILLGGQDLSGMTPPERAKLVGFMPQGLPQGVGLSVLEAVLTAERSGSAAGPDGGRALAVLDRLGLASIALSRLDSLSGGQRQLASLAQSIAREPHLLLLDEPTSALDLRAQFEVMSIARGLAAEGRIVVIVLHDLALAARWADRLVVLHGGRIHSAGLPESTLTPAMLAEVYDVEARLAAGPDGFLQIAVETTRTSR